MLGSAVEGSVVRFGDQLDGPTQDDDLRKVPEGEAIYYIGELAVTDAEMLIYTVDVTPINESSRFTVRFKKQFFVEE